MRIKWVGVPGPIRPELRQKAKGLKVSGCSDFLVCSDKGAFKKTHDYIRESLWSFRAPFILKHSKLKLMELPTHTANNINSAFEKMQMRLCEDANEIIFAMIKSFKAFCKDAIEADGRGAFLSQYDGKQFVFYASNGEPYYIYRN